MLTLATCHLSRGSLAKHQPATSLRTACSFVFTLLLLFGIVESNAPAQGRDRKSVGSAPDVIVDLGKPNVWTMDQAHYLLERNRARDLGLQTADLGAIDANDLNGVRLDSLRQLISGSVSFDSSISPANKAKMADYDQGLSRYNSLRAQRDGLRITSASLADQIAGANKTLAVDTANPAATATTQAADKAEVDRLTALKASADAQYQTLTTEMGTAPTYPTLATGSAPDVPGSGGLGDDANFKSLLSVYAKGTDSTKLAASIRLDNYINMQYELVAKQLTLLRDQAGPDNKVLFLELPQSIYVTNKLRLYPYLEGWWGAHILQTWWRLDEALIAKAPGEIDIASSNRSSWLDQRPATRNELMNMLDLFDVGEFIAKGGDSDCPANYRELLGFFRPNTGCGVRSVEKSDADTTLKAITFARRSEYATGKGTVSALGVTQDDRRGPLQIDRAFHKTPLPLLDADFNDIVNGVLCEVESKDIAKEDKDQLAKKERLRQTCAWAHDWRYSLLLSSQPTQRANQIDWKVQSAEPNLSSPPTEEPMYALDLIPRQSTLNVADAHLTQRNYGFSGLFKFLSGVGAQTRYERQRNQFGQFIQEETYASAFGKGSHEFGWTFGPLPGTNRMAPGLRTTYAIIVVPKDTRFVRMYGIGCGFRRRKVPFNPFAVDPLEESKHFSEQHSVKSEECSQQSIFDIEVPSSEDDFNVESIRYHAVPSGQRATLEITGRFGEQVGILINGSPLQKVPSITQPMLFQATYAPSASAADSTVQGVFELVNGKQLLASFVLPATFASTPKVTLVTAGREGYLNDFPYWVKEVKADGSLEKVKAEDLNPPMFTQSPAILRVDRRLSEDGKQVGLTIWGKGFNDPKSILLINGKPLQVKGSRDRKDAIRFERVNNAVMTANIDRDENFPRWTIDYMTHDGQQLSDTTFSQDDDLHPQITACSYKSTTADKKTTLDFTLIGNDFSNSLKLAPNSKFSVATSAAPKKTEFDFTADVKDGWADQNLTLTAPAPNNDSFLRVLGQAEAKPKDKRDLTYCVNSNPSTPKAEVKNGSKPGAKPQATSPAHPARSSGAPRR